MKHNSFEVIMSKIVKIFLILGSIFFVIMLVIALFITIVIVQTGDTVSLNIAKLNSYNSQIKIYDNNNEELVTTSVSGTKTINLEELPEYVPQAFISIEDKQFYSHKGINIGRIVKAGINNVLSGYAKEGASTITQQLIKNTHLNSEKTLTRKIQEAYLATQLEQKYEKDEILETYLNVIYFGNGSYGIESASQNYFGHSAKDLTLQESAILAGLIKSPKTYSPILNPENSKARRNLVLKNMLEDKVISQDEYNHAITQPLGVGDNSSTQDTFNKLILEEAMQILNLSEQDVSTMGFKIYTYINKNLQNEIEQKIKSFDNIKNAVIIIDNSNNSVITYIGNAEQKRQVGSTIKPILCYAPAFEMGKLSPITPILDEAIDYNGYSPKNANGKYLGWISARTALSKSLNVPAVKVLEYNGIEKSINIAQKFGLHFDSEDKHLAIALGATKYGENLQTMANAYSVFAKNGSYGKLNFIKKIETGAGTTIYEAKPTSHSIIGEDTSFLINDILKDTITTGTAKRLSGLNIPLCAKTGTVGITSNNTNTDAWCISYNPQFTIGAWYGNTTNSPQNNLSSTQNGGSIASDCCKTSWECLKKFSSITKEFTVPDNVEKCKIDAISLNNQKIELASETTPDMYVVSDWFSKRYAPTNYSKTFESITTPILEMITSDEKIIFAWEGVEYQNYDLYQKSNNKTTKIANLEGKNDTFKYSLTKPTQNTEFYLVSKYKNNENITKTSNIEKYYISEKVEQSPTKKIFKSWFLS